MPILSNETSSSSKKTEESSTSTSSSKHDHDMIPAKPFIERIEKWLQEAGPREQLFAVALDMMLSKKESIKKITGRDIYKDVIEDSRDTVCLVAGGSEKLDNGNAEDEAMASAIAALIAFG